MFQNKIQEYFFKNYVETDYLLTVLVFYDIICKNIQMIKRKKLNLLKSQQMQVIFVKCEDEFDCILGQSEQNQCSSTND